MNYSPLIFNLYQKEIFKEALENCENGILSNINKTEFTIKNKEKKDSYQIFIKNIPVELVSKNNKTTHTKSSVGWRKQESPKAFKSHSLKLDIKVRLLLCFLCRYRLKEKGKMLGKRRPRGMITWLKNLRTCFTKVTIELFGAAVRNIITAGMIANVRNGT